MTCEEAIRILNDILKFVEPGDPPEEHQAINLGREALNRIVYFRTYHDPMAKHSLPGETLE